MAPTSEGGKLQARRDAQAHRDSIAKPVSQEPPKKRGRPKKNRTPEDEEREAQSRKTARSKYLDALKGTRDMVTQGAKSLAATFGGGRRSEGFFEREILQSARLGKTKRKTNTWNVYLRLRLNAANASTSAQLSHLT